MILPTSFSRYSSSSDPGSLFLLRDDDRVGVLVEAGCLFAVELVRLLVRLDGVSSSIAFLEVEAETGVAAKPDDFRADRVMGVLTVP